MARSEISINDSRPRATPRVDEDSAEISLADNAMVTSPLRPRTLDAFVGQPTVRDSLRIAITAARGRKEAVDHVLFHGPAGLGKTTLAMLVAEEMGTRCVVTAGPILERPADLVSTLTSLAHGDVLFIDEVHRLKPQIEEFLYPAMEDQRIDIRIDEGPGGRTVSLPLEPFTLIGATTRAGLLTAPLRARFGLEVHLEPYGVEALHAIVLRAAGLLELSCDNPAARMIAGRSRGTPRLALRLLQRARDYAEVHGSGDIDSTAVSEALALAGVDEHGLNRLDRSILRAVVERHGGGPVGIRTLAAGLGEDVSTIEEAHEPFLLQAGLLERTSRGRVATPEAYALLGVRPAEVDQPSMF